MYFNVFSLLTISRMLILNGNTFHRNNKNGFTLFLKGFKPLIHHAIKY